jgi:poly(3-hydroxybutyrate) depolymerase
MKKNISGANKHQSNPDVSKEIKHDLLKPFLHGKQHYTITVDGDVREYYVHIPKGYNGSTTFPVVFMLHGSGANGEKFYNESGWVEVSEKENIIPVFPSSYKYKCVFDDGIYKHNAEKWTSYDLVLCDNGKKRDDIKFLNLIIDQLKQKFTVDEKRIYMVGFSNGGEMAVRSAFELSDKLAAIVACGGGLQPDTTMLPLRKLPLMVQIGAADRRILDKLGSTSPLPMDINKVLATYSLIQSNINSYINSFSLNKQYTVLTDPKKYTAALYKGNSGSEANIFKFIIIKGLTHQYANGLDPVHGNKNDHPLESAVVHWDWMKGFRLP